MAFSVFMADGAEVKLSGHGEFKYGRLVKSGCSRWELRYPAWRASDATEYGEFELFVARNGVFLMFRRGMSEVLLAPRT